MASTIVSGSVKPMVVAQASARASPRLSSFTGFKPFQAARLSKGAESTLFHAVARTVKSVQVCGNAQRTGALGGGSGAGGGWVGGCARFSTSPQTSLSSF